MHENIIRFQREGYTDNNAETREWFIAEMEKEMREEGYAPSIDNEPQYTVEYLPREECFYFTLSVFGVHVGKDESWQVSGVTAGKKIPRHIQKAKSKVS